MPEPGQGGCSWSARSVNPEKQKVIKAIAFLLKR